MELSKKFDTQKTRDEVVDILGEEGTLLSLFGEGETEIVGRSQDRITTRTHYRALGRDGYATFHFDYLMDGNIRFEKVCDGNVWRDLTGEVLVEERGDGARVALRMKGRTKTLVPEFTIKGPLEEQIAEMANALKDRLAQ